MSRATRTCRRGDDAGLILVNVLVILTLAASVVFLMISAQDGAIESVRLRAAASQAERLAEGGEASVIAALRRDMAEAPEVDHMGEDWAGVVQDEVTLADTGRFSVAVEDLQGRFDLNRLAAGIGGLTDGPVFVRLLAALSLPPDIATRIARHLREDGPLSRVDGIAAAGIGPGELAILRPHVTVLDSPRPVNLNTIGPVFLGVLLGDPTAARRMIGIRARRGFLTAQDLQGAGLLQPINTGFTSQNWQATVSAEVDGVTRVLTSRIARRPDLEPPAVFVTERDWQTEGPVAAPSVAEIERFLRP